MTLPNRPRVVTCPTCGAPVTLRRNGQPYRHWAPGRPKNQGHEPCLAVDSTDAPAASRHTAAPAGRTPSGALTTAGAALLRLIAEHDTGDGVDIADRPFGRIECAGRVFVRRTLHVLDAAGFVDVGTGQSGIAHVTAAGRSQAAALGDHRS